MLQLFMIIRSTSILCGITCPLWKSCLQGILVWVFGDAEGISRRIVNTQQRQLPLLLLQGKAVYPPCGRYYSSSRMERRKSLAEVTPTGRRTGKEYKVIHQRDSEKRNFLAYKAMQKEENNDKNLIYLPRQYLPQSYGAVHFTGHGLPGRPGGGL